MEVEKTQYAHRFFARSLAVQKSFLELTRDQKRTSVGGGLNGGSPLERRPALVASEGRHRRARQRFAARRAAVDQFKLMTGAAGIEAQVP